MNRKKESRLVTVRITGIEGARKATEENWATPIDPWYKNQIGETYKVIEREYDYFLHAFGKGIPPGYSCVRNRTIAKEDAEFVES